MYHTPLSLSTNTRTFRCLCRRRLCLFDIDADVGDDDGVVLVFGEEAELAALGGC